MSVADTWALLERLGDLREQIVLVGGQAVNVWVDHYMHRGRVPELMPGLPYTSKDVDFCGTRPQVLELAHRVRGRAVVPTLDDATSMAGYVIYLDLHGFERRIDLVAPFGMREDEVVHGSLGMQVPGLPTAMCRIMNPVHCLESRVHNVVGLPMQYHTAQGLKQLHAAVSCAREFLRDVLSAPPTSGLDPVRGVLDLNERLFRFCARNLHGKLVHARTGIDPFAAVLVDGRLGAPFVTRRYPQMCLRLESVRRKLARIVARPPGTS
jgi:hypothetical protein